MVKKLWQIKEKGGIVKVYMEYIRCIISIEVATMEEAKMLQTALNDYALKAEVIITSP